MLYPNAIAHLIKQFGGSSNRCVCFLHELPFLNYELIKTYSYETLPGVIHLQVIQIYTSQGVYFTLGLIVESIYPKPRLMILTATLIAGAVLLLLLVVLQFAIYHLVGRESPLLLKRDHFYLLLMTFACLGWLGVITALFHKCPSCGRRFLIDTGAPKHEDFEVIGPNKRWLSGWANLFRRKISCMYCGAKFKF